MKRWKRLLSFFLGATFVATTAVVVCAAETAVTPYEPLEHSANDRKLTACDGDICECRLCGKAERTDLSQLTPTEVREYYDKDGFYIVDKIYVQEWKRPTAPVVTDCTCVETCGCSTCERLGKDSEDTEAPVAAEEPVERMDLSQLTPVEVREYYDEDGFYIVDEIYVLTEEPDATIDNAMPWKRKNVAVTRSIYDDPGKNYGTRYATMVIKATFMYDGDTALVDGSPNCYTEIEPAGEGLCKIDKGVTYLGDQGSNFLAGNKYAYVKYTITITNFPKSPGSSNTSSKDFSLYVSVNRNGVQNVES